MLVYFGSFPSYRDRSEGAAANGYQKFRVEGIDQRGGRSDAAEMSNA